MLPHPPPSEPPPPPSEGSRDPEPCWGWLTPGGRGRGKHNQLQKEFRTVLHGSLSLFLFLMWPPAEREGQTCPLSASVHQCPALYLEEGGREEGREEGRKGAREGNREGRNREGVVCLLSSSLAVSHINYTVGRLGDKAADILGLYLALG